MKKLFILVCSIILMGCSVSESSSGVENQREENTLITEEVKTAIEELLPVKAIEQELVFGYAIEDARLIDNLVEGRNIDYVVEHFSKYYEEKVLEEYFYYLKRAKTQRFYREVGVFWGDHYREVGNIYKRNADSVTYKIDYQKAYQNQDVLVVHTIVYPTYHGEYTVRGESSNLYESNPKKLVFHLRKDDAGEYKLVQFSDAIINAMVEEIGEEIELNQEKEETIYPVLGTIEYETESQKLGMYLAHDVVTILADEGLDALHDKYSQVWVTIEQVGDKAPPSVNRWGAEGYHLGNFQQKISDINPSTERLRESYAGWDYAYHLFSPSHTSPWMYGEDFILVFNVDENQDISSLSFMHNIDPLKKDENLDNYKETIERFKPALNDQMNLLLGEVGGIVFNLREFGEYSKSLYTDSVAINVEGTPITSEYRTASTFYGMLNKSIKDYGRRVNFARIPYWKYSDEGRYSLIYPDGKRVIDPYAEADLILATYYCVGLEQYDCDRYSYEEGVVGLDIEVKYFYPSINLYMYGIRHLYMSRSSVLDKWEFAPEGWPYTYLLPEDEEYYKE